MLGRKTWLGMRNVEMERAGRDLRFNEAMIDYHARWVWEVRFDEGGAEIEALVRSNASMLFVALLVLWMLLRWMQVGLFK